MAYHFWSPTCEPCKAIKLAVAELHDDFPTVTWISVNTHEDPQNLAQKYNVSVVPTIVVVRIDENGTPVLTEKHSGTAMMGYYRILKKATLIQ